MTTMLYSMPLERDLGKMGREVTNTISETLIKAQHLTQSLSCELLPIEDLFSIQKYPNTCTLRNLAFRINFYLMVLES